MDKKYELNQNMNQFQDKRIEIENEKPESISTRRKILSLAFLGGAAVLGTLKEKVARADAVGGDTAAITELSNWLKVTYTTQVGPTVKALKDGYELAKGWVDKWNEFVYAYNEMMGFVCDGIRAVTTPQENIFYLQMKQMIDYVDRILEYRGNVLNFRLQYLNPVLMQKIDSYIFQGESFSSRARKLAMLNYFKKDNEGQVNEISEQNKKLFFDKIYPNSNIKKATVRASNDIANYGIQSLRIEALKQTVSMLKEKIGTYPVFPGPPPKGMAPQKSRGQVFQEISSVTSVDIGLEQLTLLNEISMKMTNLMMIVTQAGQGPIVSENESIVNKKMFQQAVKELQKSAKDSENVMFKISANNKDKA